MRHEVQLDQNGVNIASVMAKDLRAANAAADKLIQNAHNGIYGIGTFKLSIFEVAPQGYVEKCVLDMEAFHVPARVRETV